VNLVRGHTGGKNKNSEVLFISPPEGIFGFKIISLINMSVKGKLLLLFSMLWIDVNAMDTLSIGSSFQQVDILEVGSLYRTVDTSMIFEQIQQLPPSDWEPLSSTGTVLYSLRQVYWVKSTLKNNTPQAQEIYVEVGNKRINELQFFVVREKDLFRSPVTGDYHPFHRRIIAHPSMICPIQLAAGETVTVYINYIKIGETISLDTTIWKKSEFEQIYNRDSFLMAMFFGFTLCILLLSIFIALFLDAPLFRYFVIYIFACIAMALIVTGYGAMYLWPKHPYWNGMSYFSLAIYYLSLIQIMRIYFSTAEKLKGLDTFYKIAGSILIVLTLFTMLHWLLPSIIKNIAGKSGLFLLLLVNIAIIWTCFSSFFKYKNYNGLGFLAGFLFCLIAIVLFDIEQMIAISTPWGIKMTLIAILLDLCILMGLFTKQIREAYLNKMQLEQALARSKYEAADALLAGQLEERKRLSQNLHDGISIKLALFKMKLDRLWTKKDTGREEIMGDIGEIAEDIRAFTHAISPIKLNEQALEEAIEDLVYSVENATDLNIIVDFKLTEQKLSTKIKYALFYTFQELLNNTVKHANATSVSSIWDKDGTFIRLTVKDDGVGFDSSVQPAGIGFKNIHARANLLNGGFEFHSTGQGSQFIFWVEPSNTIN
jgi:signal transduction histidine kinase